MLRIRVFSFVAVIMFGSALACRAEAQTKEPELPEPQVVDSKTPGFRWVAPIGYRCGQVEVDAKYVVVGTLEAVHAKNGSIDHFHAGGSLVCFDRATGKRLWQRNHPWRGLTERQRLGIQSTPTIVDDQVYYLSNSGEFVCLKTADGALVWSIDLVKDLGVTFGPDWALSNKFCTPLVHGDYVYCVTGQGLSRWSPSLLKRYLAIAGVTPEGKKDGPPHFLCVEKRTGKIAWSSSAPGWSAAFSWSSPVLCRAGAEELIAFPGGDGALYFFEPVTGKLRLRHDLNPPSATIWRNYTIPGKTGRIMFAAEPLVVGDTLYIGTAQTMYDYPLNAPLAAIDLGRVVRGEPNVERWRIDPEKFGWLRIKPAMSKTRLFLLDDDTCELLAVDPNTGVIRGRREVPGFWVQYGPFGSLTVLGDELFLASGDGLSVYSADDRLEVRRTYEFEAGPDERGQVIGAMVASGEELFLPTDQWLFALEAKAVTQPTPPAAPTPVAKPKR